MGRTCWADQYTKTTRKGRPLWSSGLLRLHFIAVAEVALGLSGRTFRHRRSPVSRAMRDLERLRLTCSCSTAARAKTRLTWAGKVLLGEARRVLATVDHAILQRERSPRLSGTLRIGVWVTAGPAAHRVAAGLQPRGRARVGHPASLSCVLAAAQRPANDLLSTSALRYRMESTTGWWPDRLGAIRCR